MENDKLQQLTDKLFKEGLEKGRAQAEQLIEQARAEADKMLADARAEADAIRHRAQTEAEDVRKNSMTEISLAGKQALAKIKSEIGAAIVAKAVKEPIHQASLDPAFVKEMLVAVARNWNGASAGKVTLEALLPQAERERLDKSFEGVAKELAAAGVEVNWSPSLRSGFRVGQKGGGYYISFTDEDFDALLGGYLREKVAKLLF